MVLRGQSGFILNGEGKPPECFEQGHGVKDDSGCWEDEEKVVTAVGRPAPWAEDGGEWGVMWRQR